MCRVQDVKLYTLTHLTLQSTDEAVVYTSKFQHDWNKPTLLSRFDAVYECDGWTETGRIVMPLRVPRFAQRCALKRS